jgi:hypothetical protein
MTKYVVVMVTDILDEKTAINVVQEYDTLDKAIASMPTSSPSPSSQYLVIEKKSVGSLKSPAKIVHIGK